jgi:hypothetical protein
MKNNLTHLRYFDIFQAMKEKAMRRVNLKLEAVYHRAARKAAIERSQTLQAFVRDGVLSLLPRFKKQTRLES